jgi:hypothetical protein
MLGSDPFAGLPRIRPFTDFELDPIDEPPPYVGRRRAGHGPEDGDAAAGRHSRGQGEEPPEQPRGRRRAPEDGDDLLQRLIARESSRR